MIRAVLRPSVSWVLVPGAAAFAIVAGYQLGGGDALPLVPALGDEILLAAAAGLLGVGVFATLLRQPDVIGRIAPTLYVSVAILPLLRFDIPGISLIRFVPLVLVAPIAYGLVRGSEPDPSHHRVARVAVFAAMAAASMSLLVNRADTDMLRLALMVGGIVLLVGAAPRGWATTWRDSVQRALWRAFWVLVVVNLVAFAVSDSIVEDRFRGVFSSPNALAIVIALVTPLAAERSRLPAVHWTFAFFFVVASGSRGGLLALSVALVTILVRRRKIGRLAVVVLIAALVLVAGVVRTQADQEAASGVNTRSLIWAEIWEAAADEPITGHGFGAVDDFEFTAETQRWAGASPQTHSSWLDALYEQGAIGLSMWILALALGVVAAFRAGPVWGATILAGLVSATFESWLFAIGGGIGSVFWLVFGAAALSRRPDEIPTTADDEAITAEVVRRDRRRRRRRSRVRLEVGR